MHQAFELAEKIVGAGSGIGREFTGSYTVVLPVIKVGSEVGSGMPGILSLTGKGRRLLRIGGERRAAHLAVGKLGGSSRSTAGTDHRLRRSLGFGLGGMVAPGKIRAMLFLKRAVSQLTETGTVVRRTAFRAYYNVVLIGKSVAAAGAWDTSIFTQNRTPHFRRPELVCRSRRHFTGPFENIIQ